MKKRTRKVVFLLGWLVHVVFTLTTVHSHICIYHILTQTYPCTTSKNCTYKPSVPKCLSPRPNWDPSPAPSFLLQASVSRVPPGTEGGENTLACEWGGSRFERLEKKPNTLSTLFPRPFGITIISWKNTLWGLNNMYEIYCMKYAYWVSLPQTEHVDIFPVRLVSTFHRVLSVYLTLAVYLTYSSLALRAE